MIGEQDDWTPNKGEGELRRGRRGGGGDGRGTAVYEGRGENTAE